MRDLEANRPARSRDRRRLVQGAALAAALAAVLGAGAGPPAAQASVPAAPPTFQTPLVFTNAYFPFVPGAVKVFLGRGDGNRATDVDFFRADTRTFLVGATPVECRIFQETAFDDGELVEISVNYFAQANDGSVWYFGETVDNYEGGVVANHGGSWLVGGPGVGDPTETQTVAAPALFMPANPEVGDEFRPEDLPDGSVEIDTIRRVGRTVRVPAGRFTGCIEVREFSPATNETETKWYAPGVGVVAAKGKKDFAKLDSSTLRGR